MLSNVVWANEYDEAGLYNDGPVRCQWDESRGCWVSLAGDLRVAKLGMDRTRPGSIRFAAADRAEVALWTKGALMAGARVGWWASLAG